MKNRNKPKVVKQKVHSNRVKKYLKSKDFKDELKERKLKLSDFTCYDCNLVDDCFFAYHFYNLDGDCQRYN